MQADPGPHYPPASSLPDINPGPIVLLLLLPSIPLLLFGVGARPPNLAHLPFTVGDAYATGALVTCAGAVVLGMTVWPEGLEGVMGWVKGGASVGAAGCGEGVGVGEGGLGMTRRGGGHGGRGIGGHSAGLRSRDDYGAFVGGGHGGSGRGTYMGQSTPFSSQTQYVPPSYPAQAPGPPKLPRLDALRTAFAPWYSPDRPHFPTAVFVMMVTLAMLLIAIGHALGAAYDADPLRSSSSSSPSSGRTAKEGERDWVERELSAARDVPAKTEYRVKKEAERERAEKKARQAKMKEGDFEKWRKGEEGKRKRDMEKLRKVLEKDGLPLVAHDDPSTSQGTSKDKSDSSKAKPKEKDKATRTDGENGGSGGRWAERMKRVIGGSALARTTQEETERRGLGKAWEPADQAVVDATLLQSAANAEGNAARLKAEMGR